MSSASLAANKLHLPKLPKKKGPLTEPTLVADISSGPAWGGVTGIPSIYSAFANDFSLTFFATLKETIDIGIGGGFYVAPAYISTEGVTQDGLILAPAGRFSVSWQEWRNYVDWGDWVNYVDAMAVLEYFILPNASFISFSAAVVNGSPFRHAAETTYDGPVGFVLRLQAIDKEGKLLKGKLNSIFGADDGDPIEGSINWGISLDNMFVPYTSQTVWTASTRSSVAPVAKNVSSGQFSSYQFGISIMVRLVLRTKFLDELFEPKDPPIKLIPEQTH